MRTTGKAIMKTAATATAVLAALTFGLAAAQPTCSDITVTGTLSKSIRPGATAHYKLKITNKGSTTMSGVGLIAHLPPSTEYMLMRAFPKLASGDPNPFIDGEALTLSGLSIPAHKAQTLKLAVAVSSCAADTVVFRANMTGPNNCVVMAPQLETTLKRSPKDKPCAPTPAPTPAPEPFTCEIPSGTTTGGRIVYQCAPQYKYIDWGASPLNPVNIVPSATACANDCEGRGAPAFTYFETTQQCSCFTTVDLGFGDSGSFYLYCYNRDKPNAYYIGRPQNPTFVDYGVSAGDYACQLP